MRIVTLTEVLRLGFISWRKMQPQGRAVSEIPDNQHV